MSNVVTVPINGMVSDKMSLMRLWLDAMRIEPLLFAYQDVGGRNVARVGFTTASDAAKFADRFDGGEVAC